MSRSLKILFVLLVLILGLSPISPVLACRDPFYPITIGHLLTIADYLVKATVIETDDGHQNAILHVENYLYGEPGSQFLLLYRTDPMLTQSILLNADTGCDSWDHAIYRGESAFFFLKRLENGGYRFATPDLITYDDNHQIVNLSMYTFNAPESTRTVYIPQSDNREYLAIDVSESEFLKMVTEITETPPTPPDRSLPYPSTSPLKITTSKRTNYLFPVDGGLPVVIPEDSIQQLSQRLYGVIVGGSVHDSCLTLSSDEDLTVSIENGFLSLRTYEEGILPGHTFRFSPANNTIAIWNDNTIDIHTLGQAGGIYFLVEHIGSVNLFHHDNNDLDSIRGLATWSPDGSMLAYTDIEGLWLWDIYARPGPQ